MISILNREAMQMNKPRPLQPGDTIAIVSLSSGILGESFCAHQLELGVKRLQAFGLKPIFMPNTLKGSQYVADHPEARAQDLKDAFFDDSIQGILCAIGGDETYRLLPYLLEDEVFIEQVKKTPKLFTGFSDTTNNHLMFYKLGMASFYGPNFLSDLAELEDDMLPYTKAAFLSYFSNPSTRLISSSPIWYEEREEYSLNSLGQARRKHKETKGHQVLYGTGKVSGRLLGGCLESLSDGYSGSRYPEQKRIYEEYQLMPTLAEWKGKILFFETSEETPSPELYRLYLQTLDDFNIFSVLSGMIVGKPMNEIYYDEYNEILKTFAVKYHVPTIVNLNFGHATPRGVIPYGALCTLDLNNGIVLIDEAVFQET